MKAFFNILASMMLINAVYLLLTTNVMVESKVFVMSVLIGLILHYISVILDKRGNYFVLLFMLVILLLIL